MLMALASAAAEANNESRKGYPPRLMTPEEHADRLAIVRRAVMAVEELPEANERRPILAASLAVLGASTRHWRSLAGSISSSSEGRPSTRPGRVADQPGTDQSGKDRRRPHDGPRGRTG